MKSMSIETALDWAYRRELPKSRVIAANPGVMPSAWDSVTGYGALLTRVDLPMNCFGVYVDLQANGLPHPDAEAIASSVDALDAPGLFGLPEGWDPLEDLGALDGLAAGAVARGLERLTLKDREGRVGLRTPPSRLVMKHALLGGAPDWRAETPEVKTVTGPNGKPKWFRRVLVPDQAEGGWYEIEGEGFDERRRRPHADAYQKRYLEPDMAPVVVARGEYEVWRAALDLLVDDLDGELVDHVVTPSAAPARPWMGDARVAARVLRAAESGRDWSSARGYRKRAARAS